MNGDAHLDVVVAQEYSNSLGIYLGNGDGTFRRPATIATARFPTAIVLHDSNSDGALDLVCRRLGGVTMFRGTGDGSFAAVDSIEDYAIGFDILVADLNADGHGDLVTARGRTVVFMGREDGSFGPAVFSDRGDGWSPVLADLDGDSRLDLASGFNDSSQSGIRVRFGNGDGTFSAGTRIPLPSVAYSLAVGDLNGDGAPELVAGYYRVFVLDNLGGGTFGAPREIPDFRSPRTLALTDLDADGHLDLVAPLDPLASTDVSHDVTVLRGHGDGTFAAARSFHAGVEPWVSRAGDFDEDGTVDLAVINRRSFTLAILPGNGDCSFGFVSELATGVNAHSMAVADLDRDGNLDVVIAGGSTRVVRVLFGDGNGAIRSRSDHHTGNWPWFVVLADLDGNGWLDMGVADGSSNEVAISLGSGGGAFAPRSVYATEARPRGLVFLDLNDDRALDLVVANRDAGTFSIRLGRGDGTFGPPRTQGLGGGFVAMASADLDSDGRSDLVVASAGWVGRLSVYLNRGVGQLLWIADTEIDLGPSSVAVADLTGDARLDVAVVSAVRHRASVLPGRGDGTFGDAIHAYVRSPVSVAIADFDRDGAADLACTNAGIDAVTTIMGTGVGAFTPLPTLGCGPDAWFLAIADMNRDGRPDLLNASGTGNLSILLNRMATTPVFVEDLLATFLDRTVTIEWTLMIDAGEPAFSVSVQRATTPVGPWLDLTPQGLVVTRHMSFSDPGVEPHQTYWYRVAVRRDDGSVHASAATVVHTGEPIERATALRPPILDPSGEVVHLAFTVAWGGSHVRVAVYDTRGRELWASQLPAVSPGDHVLHWPRRDRNGRRVVRGIYFVRLEAAGAVAVRKLALLR